MEASGIHRSRFKSRLKRASNYGGGRVSRILPAFLSITVTCAGSLKCVEEDSKEHKKCHWSSPCDVV